MPLETRSIRSVFHSPIVALLCALGSADGGTESIQYNRRSVCSQGGLVLASFSCPEWISFAAGALRWRVLDRGLATVELDAIFGFSHSTIWLEFSREYFLSKSVRSRHDDYYYFCVPVHDMWLPQVDHGPSDLNSQESWELLPKIEVSDDTAGGGARCWGTTVPLGGE